MISKHGTPVNLQSILNLFHFMNYLFLWYPCWIVSLFILGFDYTLRDILIIPAWGSLLNIINSNWRQPIIIHHSVIIIVASELKYYKRYLQEV